MLHRGPSSSRASEEGPCDTRSGMERVSRCISAMRTIPFVPSPLDGERLPAMIGERSRFIIG